MFGVESGDVIDQAHATHLASDCLQGAFGKTVFLTEVVQARHVLSGSVFEIYEDSQEYPLVVSVAREQQLGQLLHILNAGNLVGVEFDLGAWRFFHPCLFDANAAFFERIGLKAMLKKFFPLHPPYSTRPHPTENCAIRWPWCAGGVLDGLRHLRPLYRGRIWSSITGGQIPLQFGEPRNGLYGPVFSTVKTWISGFLGFSS